MNNFIQGVVVELGDGLKYYIVDSVVINNVTFLQLAKIINSETDLANENIFARIDYIDNKYILNKISTEDMIKYGLIDRESGYIMEDRVLEKIAKEIQDIKNNKYGWTDEQFKLFCLKYMYPKNDLFDNIRLRNYNLSKILNCDMKNLEFGLEDYVNSPQYLNKNLKYYFGNLNINFHFDINNITLPEIVIGSIKLDWLDNYLKLESKLELPKVICGDLLINNFKDVDNLILPKRIYGKLIIDNIEIFEKCKNMELLYSLDLKILESNFNSDILYDLPKGLSNVNMLIKANNHNEGKSIIDIKIPPNIKKFSISNIQDKVNILEIHEGIEELSIESDINIGSVRLPNSIEVLCLNGVKKFNNIHLPKNLKELYLNGVIECTNLTIPNGLQVLSMNELIKFDNLVIPQTVEELFMNKIKYLNNISIPKNIRSLSLNSLLNANKLILPSNMDGLSLNSLSSVKGLKFPKKVSLLFLNGLKKLDGLELPKSIIYLSLNNLENANGIEFPESLLRLDLNGLKGKKSLILPQFLNRLYLNNLYKTDELLWPDSCCRVTNVDVYLKEMPTKEIKEKFESSTIALKQNEEVDQTYDKNCANVNVSALNERHCDISYEKFNVDDMNI